MSVSFQSGNIPITLQSTPVLRNTPIGGNDDETLATVNAIEDYAYRNADIVLTTDIVVATGDTLTGPFDYKLNLPDTKLPWGLKDCFILENYVDLETLYLKPDSETTEPINVVRKIKSKLIREGITSVIEGTVSNDSSIKYNFRIACVLLSPDEIVENLSEPNSDIQITFGSRTLENGEGYVTIADYLPLAQKISIEADGRKDKAGKGLVVKLDGVRKPTNYFELWSQPGELRYGADKSKSGNDNDGKGDDEEEEEEPAEEYPFENSKCEFYINGKRQPKDAFVTSTTEASAFGDDVLQINLNPGQDLIVAGENIKFVCPEITVHRSIPGFPTNIYVGSYVYGDGIATWHDSTTMIHLRNNANTAALGLLTIAVTVSSMFALLF